MINPIAFSDTLNIIVRLQSKLEEVSKSEVQIFGYLACLLYLYDGNPISTWGYNFISNEFGGPFSKEVDDSLNQLMINGSMDIVSDNYFRINDIAISRYKELKNFKTNSERAKYIDASCDSILMLPLGIIRESLFNEPSLKSAIKLNSKRLLLDENGSSIEIIYQQFDILKRIFGHENIDLLIPANSWLNFLYKTKETIVNK